MTKRSYFVVGLAVCLVAAALMVLGWLNLGWGAAVGMIGVGLLAASATRTDDT